ncbi:Uncharacterised protein [Neisseria meningitidis]|nr:Uncharacterised protein [Neisseria meningitidis]
MDAALELGLGSKGFLAGDGLVAGGNYSQPI